MYAVRTHTFEAKNNSLAIFISLILINVREAYVKKFLFLLRVIIPAYESVRRKSYDRINILKN